MKEMDKGKAPFRYLSAVTVISVLLIMLNGLLGMRIPFSVVFLLGYVGASLVYVVWHAILTKGWKRSLLMFCLSFVVAFSAEALGVNYGLVFGHYYYTPILGISLFGVPLLAALAWEPIVYAAFCLSDMLSARVSSITSLSAQKSSPILAAAIGALATTAWDLMIDPIAVSQGWWVWVGGGPYVPYVANGVPIQNFLGWLGVAFVINLIYRKVADGINDPSHSPTLTFYGPLTLYSSLFLTAFGVAITVLQRPEVALVGVLAMGPFIVIALTNMPLFLFNLRHLSKATELETKI
ncbi:MAG: carotenoid biosynthesis protein [Anaerolineales bacterium]